MAAGSADAGDLGWGTAAERGLSDANWNSACRLGAINAGWGGSDADIRSARSQGANVFGRAQGVTY
jgi:hypothetical protein